MNRYITSVLPQLAEDGKKHTAAQHQRRIVRAATSRRLLYDRWSTADIAACRRRTGAIALHVTQYANDIFGVGYDAIGPKTALGMLQSTGNIVDCWRS